MSLAAAARRGRYEIVEPIGAGGMGEVCRATTAPLAAITVVVNWMAGIKT